MGTGLLVSLFVVIVIGWFNTSSNGMLELLRGGSTLSLWNALFVMVLSSNQTAMFFPTTLTLSKLTSS